MQGKQLTNTANNANTNTQESACAAKQPGQFKAYLLQDISSLLRTPAFLQQFVVSPLLVPVVVIAAGLIGMFAINPAITGSFLSVFSTAAIDANSHLLMLAIALGIAFLCCIPSYAFAFALGRDGEEFFHLRAEGLNMKAYIKAKFLSQFLLGRLPFYVVLFIALVVLGTALDSALITTLAIALPVAAVDLALLGLGSKVAKFSWQYPADLFKQASVFTYIVVSLLLGLVAVGLAALAMCLFAYVFYGVSAYIGALALLVVCIAEVLVAGFYAFNAAANNLKRF